MKLFRMRRPPVPVIAEEVKVDPDAAAADLAKSANYRQDAEALDGAARQAVESLARSRIRNGFAPVIENTIIRRHLGGAQ